MYAPLGRYDWLAREQGPRTLVEGLKFHGLKEIVGSRHNPVILGWAKELGIPGYTADEIPWCGLYAAKVVNAAGFTFVKDPLWARNWAKWGNPEDYARLGDVLVFVRDGGGHVGFYVGEDQTHYHVLGGNQSNGVSITRIAQSRCIAKRSCPWKVGPPVNYRRVVLPASGVISENEA